MHALCHADNMEMPAHRISRLPASELKIIPLGKNPVAIALSMLSTTPIQTQYGVPIHAPLECNGKLQEGKISL